MKLCKDCKHFKTEAVDVGGRFQQVPLCFHPECRHPVYGEPIPAEMARRELVFCGFGAKYHEPKESEAPKGLIEIK